MYLKEPLGLFSNKLLSWKIQLKYSNKIGHYLKRENFENWSRDLKEYHKLVFINLKYNNLLILLCGQKSY